MLSFRRSALLALTLMSGSIADVQAGIERKTHQDWFSDVAVERLQDTSILVEYYGESTSKEQQDVVFRIGFIPRFGCAPLITFKFGDSAINTYGLGGGAESGGLANVKVTIDGALLSFPSLVDSDSSEQSLYLNASLQRRITARLRVEVGSNLQLELASGQKLRFSLSGSRDAISNASQNCRTHVPGEL